MRRVWIIIVMLTAVGEICCADPPESHSSQPIISHIPRQRVDSTAIAKVGYSKRRHILEIEFANGAVYRYLDVPSSVYRDLMSAESKARYYDFNIKGKYRPVHVWPRGQRQISELKGRLHLRFEALRQRFVLTREEKRVIAFVLLAFALGLAVKHYRDMHPQPVAPPSKKTYRSRLYSPSPTPTSTALFKFTEFSFLPWIHVCARPLSCGSFRREGTR